MPAGAGPEEGTDADHETHPPRAPVVAPHPAVRTGRGGGHGRRRRRGPGGLFGDRVPDRRAVLSLHDGRAGLGSHAHRDRYRPGRGRGDRGRRQGPGRQVPPDRRLRTRDLAGERARPLRPPEGRQPRRRSTRTSRATPASSPTRTAPTGSARSALLPTRRSATGTARPTFISRCIRR